MIWCCTSRELASWLSPSWAKFPAGLGTLWPGTVLSIIFFFSASVKCPPSRSKILFSDRENERVAGGHFPRIGFTLSLFIVFFWEQVYCAIMVMYKPYNALHCLSGVSYILNMSSHCKKISHISNLPEILFGNLMSLMRVLDFKE